jgi:hypothetical protein
MQQAAAKTGKAGHQAKAKIGRFSLGELRGPATSRNERQRLANLSFSASPETVPN